MEIVEMFFERMRIQRGDVGEGLGWRLGKDSVTF
jgi:hypothetical protein